MTKYLKLEETGMLWRPVPVLLKVSSNTIMEDLVLSTQQLFKKKSGLPMFTGSNANSQLFINYPNTHMPWQMASGYSSFYSQEAGT